MKSLHESVVVGLAGMVQEQPATRLAGMDPAEIYINMQKNMQLCVKLCLKYAKYAGNMLKFAHYMLLYAINMQLYALNMQKKYANI